MLFFTIICRASATTLPAPGYRRRETGALYYVGCSGYSWSSTPYNSGDHYRGMHLDFGVTHLGPNYTTHRAYSHQLRCLSE